MTVTTGGQEPPERGRRSTDSNSTNHKHPRKTRMTQAFEAHVPGELDPDDFVTIRVPRSQLHQHHPERTAMNNENNQNNEQNNNAAANGAGDDAAKQNGTIGEAAKDLGVQAGADVMRKAERSFIIRNAGKIAMGTLGAGVVAVAGYFGYQHFFNKVADAA